MILRIFSLGTHTSYGAIAWWYIMSINFGRWSFFIINVQLEHRNLLGYLGGKCTAFSPLWSGMPNCFFSPLFYWLKATLVSKTVYSSYYYASPSPFLSDLHPSTPCLVLPPLLNLMLCCYFLLFFDYCSIFLVSVLSSFLPLLFNRDMNIISEDCETGDNPWYSWEPYDFGLSRA